MATSGSVDFASTGIEVIKDALVMVGAIEDESTPSDEQNAYCKRILNRMLKAWSVRGLKTWKWQEAELQLVPGTNQYLLGPGGDLVIDRPVEIINPRRVVDFDSETEIRVESRNTFMNQPSKDSEGKVVYVYLDTQLAQSILWVWPAPDDVDTLKFSYKSYIQDIDNNSDNFEFPPEWEEAIVYGLALRLIPKYEVTGEDAARITAMATQFLDDAETNDTDQGSIFLQPEYYA